MTEAMRFPANSRPKQTSLELKTLYKQTSPPDEPSCCVGLEMREIKFAHASTGEA